MHSSRLLAVFSLLALAAPMKAEVKKAVGSIELADAAGDCSPIHSSERDYPGFDVVKLALASDGQRLTITATLKEPPGVFASEVAYLYIDTDRNEKTGAAMVFPKSAGWEFKGELDACASYSDGSAACVGGSAKAKVTAHYAEAGLERYKGTDPYDREDVVDLMGFPGKQVAPHVPIVGNVVTAAFDYTDLKVKPGQTIRVLMEEACGSSAPDNGYFPEVLLTLK